MRVGWLIGCVVLAGSACGGVVRSSPSGAGGETSVGGSSSMSTGATSPSGGSTSMGGQSSRGGQAAGGAITGVGGKASTCLPSSPPVVLACAQEAGKFSDPTVAVGFSLPQAKVLGEIPGVAEGGCLERLLGQQTNGAALLDQAMSWTIGDGKQVLDVEVAVEGIKLPSLAGQAVSLKYAYQFGGFGPTHRELSVVSLMSGSHGVWTAEGGDVPGLENLPFPFSRGPRVCAATEECGSYERYDLSVIDPPSMKKIDVPYGKTTTFGPWVVVHGGYEEQTGPGKCPDWFIADVHVAVVGLM